MHSCTDIMLHFSFNLFDSWLIVYHASVEFAAYLVLIHVFFSVTRRSKWCLLLSSVFCNGSFHEFKCFHISCTPLKNLYVVNAHYSPSPCALPSGRNDVFMFCSCDLKLITDLDIMQLMCTKLQQNHDISPIQLICSYTSHVVCMSRK